MAGPLSLCALCWRYLAYVRNWHIWPGIRGSGPGWPVRTDTLLDCQMPITLAKAFARLVSSETACAICLPPYPTWGLVTRVLLVSIRCDRNDKKQTAIMSIIMEMNSIMMCLTAETDRKIDGTTSAGGNPRCFPTGVVRGEPAGVSRVELAGLSRRRLRNCSERRRLPRSGRFGGIVAEVVST